MPSMYSSTIPMQVPLTPPDTDDFTLLDRNAGVHYQPTTCTPRSKTSLSSTSGSAYHQFAQASFSGLAQDKGFDAGDRFTQQPRNAHSMNYRQPQSFVDASRQASTMCCYEPIGAPLLPPMRVFDQSTTSENNLAAVCVPGQAMQMDEKVDKPVGGVSAKLDYDMEQMTDYVAEMTQGLYAFTRSPIPMTDVDIVQSVLGSHPVSTSFRKWVSQVLCATRLPSATILMSLHYLGRRLTALSSSRNIRFGEGDMYRMLTVSLILGSKFLDDNTFINRSWSEVSGFNVAELNRLELDWLLAFNWDLHQDPAQESGFDTWHCHWKQYRSRSQSRMPRQPGIHTNDTSLKQRSAVRGNYSPTGFKSGSSVSVYADRYQQGQNCSFVQYDPWANSRNPVHTTPPHRQLSTSVDYYSRPGMWATHNQYSRSGSSCWPNFERSSYQQYNQQQFIPHWSNQSPWAGHGLTHPNGCHCLPCSRQNSSYLMNSGYGMQTVVG